MKDKDYLILYMFVNTGLESMNYGKALAQASHVSNAFTFQNKGLLLDEWMKQTDQGFGTVSCLIAENWLFDISQLEDDLSDLVNTDHGYQNVVYKYVYDPEYPFLVSDEIYGLLSPRYTEGATQMPDGKWLCVRNETTGFYVFGRKSNEALQNIMKRFKRHP